MMDNANCRTFSRRPPRPEVIDLYVRDGAQEMRLNVRAGARRLQAEGGHLLRTLEDRLPLPGPLALVGGSVEKAASTMAQVIGRVDRTAQAWLAASAGPGEAAPLPSSASHFAAGTGAGALRAFTHDHGWRYRRWLALRGESDAPVREHAIAQAALDAAARRPGPGGAQDPLPWLAILAAALAGAPILRPPRAGNVPHEDAAAERPWQAALAVVLAGELCARGAAASAGEALRMADEIVRATRPAWRRAPSAREPADAVLAWLRFSLRHA